MLNSSASLAMPTSVLKRHSLSILNLSSVEIPNIILYNMEYGVGFNSHTYSKLSFYVLIRSVSCIKTLDISNIAFILRNENIMQF